MGYYILTFLFTMWIPYAIQIVGLFLSVASITPIPMVVIVSLVLVPIVCFLAMMGYGYWVTNPKRNHPESMTGIYMPVILPLLWYLFVTALMNYNHVSIRGLMGSLIQMFLLANMYGELFYGEFSSGHINYINFELLGSLIYYGVLIAGFAVGERCSAHKAHIERKHFASHRKQLVILFTAVFCFYVPSEVVAYKERQNIVLSSGSGYGFAYENGYSSTDLEPYYVENESNILAKLDESATFTIYDPIDMPVLDGAEAAYPVYSAFANACYANISEIQTYGKEQREHGTVDESYIVMPIKFTNSIYAYEKLLDGKVDICFGARPSEEQIQMADARGKELILTPIGKEGFVFFVNGANPVNELSSEQLKSIYSGEINNWRKVGGENKRILAYQRPENSGSQTMMKYFMGDTPLKDPLKTEEASMGGVVRTVASYDNGTASIGYSFRYFASIMVEESSDENGSSLNHESGNIKFLAVDGVYPDEETIRSGEYPLSTELYAITVIDKYSPSGTYKKDTIEPFLEWMTGPQGQQIVADTGYVSLE